MVFLNTIWKPERNGKYHWMNFLPQKIYGSAIKAWNRLRLIKKSWSRNHTILNRETKHHDIIRESPSTVLLTLSPVARTVSCSSWPPVQAKHIQLSRLSIVFGNLVQSVRFCFWLIEMYWSIKPCNRILNPLQESWPKSKGKNWIVLMKYTSLFISNLPEMRMKNHSVRSNQTFSTWLWSMSVIEDQQRKILAGVKY